jgi:hypothetical protein
MIFTPTALAPGEEYGGERRWSTELGRALTEAGDGALWPSPAAGLLPAAVDT